MPLTDTAIRNAMPGEKLAKHHGDRIIRRVERDIFPWIGGRPIADVTAPELLAAAQRIESRGALLPVRGEHFAAVTETEQVAP